MPPEITGIVAERQAQREAALARYPQLAAKIMGTRPAYEAPAKVHVIAVDCRTGERSVKSVDKAAERPAPIAPPALLYSTQIEVDELMARRASLLHEIAALERQAAKTRAAASLAKVTEQFLAELEDAGYLIDGRAMTLEDLRSQRRSQVFSRPRQVAMALCRDIARNASLPQIAAHFGNRDHTTAIYACRRAPDLTWANPLLRSVAFAVCEALGEGCPTWLTGRDA